MRLIDAEKLKAVIQNIINHMQERFGDKPAILKTLLYAFQMFTDIVDSQSTVEVKEPEADETEWVESPIAGYLYCDKCHNCYVSPDWVNGSKWKFCPECGRKVRKQHE